MAQVKGQSLAASSQNPAQKWEERMLPLFRASAGSDISDWGTENPVSGWQRMLLFSLHKLL